MPDSPRTTSCRSAAPGLGFACLRLDRTVFARRGLYSHFRIFLALIPLLPACSGSISTVYSSGTITDSTLSSAQAPRVQMNHRLQTRQRLCFGGVNQGIARGLRAGAISLVDESGRFSIAIAAALAFAGRP